MNEILYCGIDTNPYCTNCTGLIANSNAACLETFAEHAVFPLWFTAIIIIVLFGMFLFIYLKENKNDLV
jgi:hypothetical protein